jgi:bis(5'-nucleosyl)-tetraphosphatase (symmetrical)
MRSRAQVFVGDVQGCDESSPSCSPRAGEFGSEFELWSVGDLINRGPDNRGPLARVRELEERGRARCVLGNHELSLLKCWFGLREVSEFDTFQDVLDAPDAGEWVDWIRPARSPAPGSSAGSRSRWSTRASRRRGRCRR